MSPRSWRPTPVEFIGSIGDDFGGCGVGAGNDLVPTTCYPALFRRLADCGRRHRAVPASTACFVLCRRGLADAAPLGIGASPHRRLGHRRRHRQPCCGETPTARRRGGLSHLVCTPTVLLATCTASVARSIDFEATPLMRAISLRRLAAVRHASIRAGLQRAHVHHDRQCEPAGDFAGPLVVSMRPMPAGIGRPSPADHRGLAPAPTAAPCTSAILPAWASEICRSPSSATLWTSATARCPCSGLAASRRTLAIVNARPEMAITHEPGHMFITDLPAEANPSRDPIFR